MLSYVITFFVFTFITFRRVKRLFVFEGSCRVHVCFLFKKPMEGHSSKMFLFLALESHVFNF